MQQINTIDANGIAAVRQSSIIRMHSLSSNPPHGTGNWLEQNVRLSRQRVHAGLWLFFATEQCVECLVACLACLGPCMTSPYNLQISPEWNFMDSSSACLSAAFAASSAFCSFHRVRRLLLPPTVAKSLRSAWRLLWQQQATLSLLRQRRERPVAGHGLTALRVFGDNAVVVQRIRRERCQVSAHDPSCKVASNAVDIRRRMLSARTRPSLSRLADRWTRYVIRPANRNGYRTDNRRHWAYRTCSRSRHDGLVARLVFV